MLRVDMLDDSSVGDVLFYVSEFSDFLQCACIWHELWSKKT